ncbi:MAG: YigZ family protein [Bacillota bacterium]|nr:YigZ family protein [Bacillota bacterium]
MSVQGSFYTLKEPAIVENIIKKSRFIAHASPVSSEEEALDFVKSIKDLHKTATHNCYAYIIGANAGLMRYQDDGEPQGTAGKPILDVLMRNNLVNCAVVVTRYFGGILLGAGGLVRAYSGSTALAVKAAKIVISESSVKISSLIDYVYWDKINYHLASLPVCEIEKDFTDKVLLTFTVRQIDENEVMEKLTSLTDGSAEIIASDPFFHQWESDFLDEDDAAIESDST